MKSLFIFCLFQMLNAIGVFQRTLPAQDNFLRYEFTHPAMGIEFHLVLYAQNVDLANQVFELAKSRIDQLDKCLSDYRQDSEVNQLCSSAPHGEFQVVSPDLQAALTRSICFSKLTSGAFDCSIGPSSHLWRAAIKRNRLPSEDQIAAAIKPVGWQKIHSNQMGQFKLTVPGMQLDFGGIAQGIAADEVLKIFRSYDIPAALVDASGDIATLGAPPRAAGWQIVIDDGVNPLLQLTLRDLAVSTSGDRAQALILDGERHSHLVDPRTGRATKNENTATVIATNATSADALASAFCILDFQQAQQIATCCPDIHARISWTSRDTENTRKHHLEMTSGFQQFVTDTSDR